LTRILIPRSDSISAKVVEPSDFEGFNSSDIVADYVKSGFTVADNDSGLQCTVAAGVLRLKGLYVQSTATETVTGLSDSTTNHIYAVLARDGNAEAESWSFSTNTTGSTPTDGIKIGTAVTSGGQVTTVTSAPPSTSPYNNLIKTVDIQNNAVDGTKIAMGSDAAGDVLYNNGTDYVRLAKGTAKQKLTMNSGATAPEWNNITASYCYPYETASENFNSTQNTAVTDGYAMIGNGNASWVSLPDDGRKAVCFWHFDTTGASTNSQSTAGYQVHFGERVTAASSFPSNDAERKRCIEYHENYWNTTDVKNFNLNMITNHTCSGQNVNIWYTKTAYASGSYDTAFHVRVWCEIYLFDSLTDEDLGS
jgi:hypothetical protein